MRTPRLCLVYVIFILTVGATLRRNVIPGTPMQNMAAAGIQTKRDVDPALRISLPSTNVTLEQQPDKELQNTVFRTQPKLRLSTDTMPFMSDNETINVFYVTVTLRWDQTSSSTNNDTDTDHADDDNDGGPKEEEEEEASTEAEDAQLFGATSVSFDNGWANFTNLGITLLGVGINNALLQSVLTLKMASGPDRLVVLIDVSDVMHRYTLEFMVRSRADENNTCRLTSRKFDVFEYPLKVIVSKVETTHLYNQTFSAVINLGLWDFVKNTTAQADTINNTEWRYIVSLRHNDEFHLVGNTTGSFPPGSSSTGFLKFHLTTIGYRLQINVIVDSPAYKTRIETISEPFDALRRFTIHNPIRNNVTLTFNGSLDGVHVTEELFITTFLNNFGIRYSDVKWLNPTVQNGGSVVVDAQLEGRNEELNETTQDLWRDAQSGYQLTVRGVMFMMQNKLSVDGKPFVAGQHTAEYTLYGFSLPALFTIVLMSVLSAAFVIAVLLWQIREKRVMESYNKRMKAQRRQNGHVNTAYDSSNESVQRARQEVYLIAMNERARVEREREQQHELQQHLQRQQQRSGRGGGGCSAEDAPLRRCSSGGIPRYKYYRRVNARLGSDDDEVLGAVSARTPLDDDMVFADIERFETRHDFAEVFYSPSHKRRPTISSMTSSVHDEYYLRDAPGPSSRYMQRTNRGKCSITASTASGSLCSLPNTSSRSVSKVMVNSTSGDMNAYALPRPPSGHWSSSTSTRDDKHRMCNGKGLLSPSSSAIC